MRKLSPLKTTYFLAISALAMCQFACSSCNPQPTYANATVTIQGVIGSDCNFSALAGISNPQIEISVYDSGTVRTHHQYVSNVPNSTYAIQVPTKGPFDIVVEATELCSSPISCPTCAARCKGGTQDGLPHWRGTEHSQLGGAAGGTYAVTVQLLGVGPGGLGCACC